MKNERNLGMIEVEVKSKITSVIDVEQTLIAMGFTKNKYVAEEDTYFDNNEGYIRTSGSAMRIRRITDLETGKCISQINFKGVRHDMISMTRDEFETQIANATTMQQILNLLGYKAVDSIVRKNRMELVNGDMTACLDCVEGLGDFLELEIMVENKNQEAAALCRINAVLEELGDLVMERTNISYLSQLLGQKF